MKVWLLPEATVTALEGTIKPLPVADAVIVKPGRVVALTVFVVLLPTLS